MRSTVALKAAMAVPGLVMVLYLLAHMYGNLKVFSGQAALFFEQIETEVASNERAQAVAMNNDMDQFMTVFDDLLEGVIIDRHTANDALLTAFLDKPDFREAMTIMIGNEFYKSIRDRAAE